MDVPYTRKRMTDYNNAEISINRWFELFRVAEKRSLPAAGSIILMYHMENPMEQFFKSTCEPECMLPVKKGGTGCPNIKPFGGFNAATALRLGDYETISSTHLKLLKWIEAQGLKQSAALVCENFRVGTMGLSADQIAALKEWGVI